MEQIQTRFKEIENDTIKLLEIDSSKVEYRMKCLDCFKNWLDDLYPNAESIKAVVVGCAVFKAQQQINRITAETKLDKNEAKYKIKFSQVYLDISNQYLNCVK